MKRQVTHRDIFFNHTSDKELSRIYFLNSINQGEKAGNPKGGEYKPKFI